MPDQDPWENHDDFQVEDWRSEVANDDTRLGYQDWVTHKREDARSDRDRRVAQQVHLFKDSAGDPHEWTMEDVVDKGFPVDDNTGDDMEYVGPKPPESKIGNYFAMHELDSTYADADNRFIVSFIVGYEFSEEYGVTNIEEAAAAALKLATDIDSNQTQWYVHDRETGKTTMLEQEEFTDG